MGERKKDNDLVSVMRKVVALRVACALACIAPGIVFCYMGHYYDAMVCFWLTVIIPFEVVPIKLRRYFGLRGFVPELFRMPKRKPWLFGLLVAVMFMIGIYLEESLRPASESYEANIFPIYTLCFLGIIGTVALIIKVIKLTNADIGGRLYSLDSVSDFARDRYMHWSSKGRFVLSGHVFVSKARFKGIGRKRREFMESCDDTLRLAFIIKKPRSMNAAEWCKKLGAVAVCEIIEHLQFGEYPERNGTCAPPFILDGEKLLFMEQEIGYVTAEAADYGGGIPEAYILGIEVRGLRVLDTVMSGVFETRLIETVRQDMVILSGVGAVDAEYQERVQSASVTGCERSATYEHC
jgi:hypothetical protein